MQRILPRRTFATIGRIQPVKQPVKTLQKTTPSVWRKRGEEVVNWAFVLGGLGLMGAVGYALFGELFGSSNEVYLQLYEEAAYFAVHSPDVKRRFGSNLKASFGPRNTNRNRLMTGEEWGVRKKFSVVQFYVSSSSEREGLVTAKASRLKNNTLQLETIQVEDLSDSSKPIINVDIGRNKKKSRFGFM